jgi:hypothetical protein
MRALCLLLAAWPLDKDAKSGTVYVRDFLPGNVGN